MVAVHSTMLPLGTEAPDFNLSDCVTGQKTSLANFKGYRALLVAFICNHCPFVVHVREPMVALIKEFQPKGLGAVAISSNDVEKYPEDAPSQMAVMAKKSGFTFPYLFDETQQVAQAYHAACTPDFYVFDAQRRLVYRGRFDDSRPGRPSPANGADLRSAIEAALAGQRVAETAQKASVGCNIKWRRGNEPVWFTT